jgi:excisionase family DNA binding protein
MAAIFTTVQVAKMCKVGEAKVRDWVDQKLLRAYKTPGGKYRYQAEALRVFLQEQPGMGFALQALEAAVRSKAESQGLGLRRKRAATDQSDWLSHPL